MAYKNLKKYRKDILLAFDRAGGANRLKRLMDSDDTFLYVFEKICRLLPREVDNKHSHDISLRYISNTPRPELPNYNDDNSLDSIQYSIDGITDSDDGC